jgi:hypothetical protein
MSRCTRRARAWVGVVSIISACNCAGTADPSRAAAGHDEKEAPEQGRAAVTERSGDETTLDPFTAEAAPALASLERVAIENPPVRLSWNSHMGRVGDLAAVVTRDASQTSSTWLTIDDAGAWREGATLPFITGSQIVGCDGLVVVGGATETEFLYFVVSSDGEVERSLEVDASDALTRPQVVCRERGPALVWVNRDQALVVASEGGRHVIELDLRTSSIAAAAVGDAIAIVRAYHDRPQVVGHLEVLLVKDGAIVRRVDVGEGSHATHCNLVARPGYLLALWSHGDEPRIASQVIASDLSRTGEVRSLYETSGRMASLLVVESAAGDIAAVWDEERPSGQFTPEGHVVMASGRRAALVDSLGRRLGEPVPILSNASQYHRAAWAGQHLVAFGGGRAARVERYRVVPASP